jgi:hypothetical protein
MKSGTQIGPCQITASSTGAGGMGEVLRAGHAA